MKDPGHSRKFVVSRRRVARAHRRREAAAVLAGRARPLRALAPIALASVLLAACRSGELQDPPPAPAAPPPASAAAAPGAGGARTARASERQRPLAPKPWRIPVDPKLLIAPGQGLGPIRFGARLETVERLIGEPCEDKREDAGKLICRYSAQAADFIFEGGELTEMRAHRLGRPFKPELDYGIFNGSFAEGVAFGMVPAAASELLGKPRRVQVVEGENPNHTVERHDYGSFELEFDRISPQSVVLGGVILKRAPR